MHFELTEEQRMIRETVRELLELTGRQVLEASNAEEALRIFGDDPQAVDAVVTDIVMPGMNGWQLGSRIRELRPGLPTLYISGFTDGTAEPHHQR